MCDVLVLNMNSHNSEVQSASIEAALLYAKRVKVEEPELAAEIEARYAEKAPPEICQYEGPTLEEQDEMAAKALAQASAEEVKGEAVK